MSYLCSRLLHLMILLSVLFSFDKKPFDVISKNDSKINLIYTYQKFSESIKTLKKKNIRYN